MVKAKCHIWSLKERFVLSFEHLTSVRVLYLATPGLRNSLLSEFPSRSHLSLSGSTCVYRGLMEVFQFTWWLSFPRYTLPAFPFISLFCAKGFHCDIAIRDQGHPLHYSLLLD
jgi:hypothetical protein